MLLKSCRRLSFTLISAFSFANSQRSGGDGGGDGSAARLRLDALVASLDGARRLVVREAGSAREAEALGARAARSLLEAGAAGIADLRAGRAGGSTGGRR